MDELLWLFRKRSQTLQSFRSDIVGLWADEAAKEINLRFLDPHEQDDHNMHYALQDQKRQLCQSQLEINQAQDYALTADTHAQEVQRSLELQRQETQEAHQYYDEALDSLIAVQKQLPQIEAFIQKANRACAI